MINITKSINFKIIIFNFDGTVTIERTSYTLNDSPSRGLCALEGFCFCHGLKSVELHFYLLQYKINNYFKFKKNSRYSS